MAIAYKEGVSGEPTAAIRQAIAVAEQIYAAAGVPTLTVTSLRDGRHSAGSLHYSGNAVDLRIWELNARGKTAEVAARLRAALGADYDVVPEADHIHIEYDPKGVTAASPPPAPPGGSRQPPPGGTPPDSTLIIGIALVAAALLMTR